jgi:uncharacterized membrane protein HdeD (DUF308 family)
VGFINPRPGGYLLSIQGALNLRRIGLPWSWNFAWGVVCVIVAVIAFIQEPATLDAIIALLAIYALISGTILLVAGWRVGSIPKRLSALAPPKSNP